MKNTRKKNTAALVTALLDGAETLMARSRKSASSRKSPDNRAAALARAEREIAQPKASRGDRLRMAERDVAKSAPKDARLIFAEMSLPKKGGRG
jgi:hypothetical protein